MVHTVKVKISVTLSEDLVGKLDALSDTYGNRSACIERAVRLFLVAEEQRHRDARDLKILNEHADALNEEALDVLAYQVDR